MLKSYERAIKELLVECEVEAGKRGPSCHVVGDAVPSQQLFWPAGLDASDKGLNVQELFVGTGRLRGE